MPDVDPPGNDQQLAIKTTAKNRRHDFDSIFGTGTLELLLPAGLEQFAHRTKFTRFFH